MVVLPGLLTIFLGPGPVTATQVVNIALHTSFAMAVAALAPGLEGPGELAETLQFGLLWQRKTTDES
jgi:hypothetical protein